MQTFLPYPSFSSSAKVLDRQRLGKQRLEAWQIYCALTVPNYGWQNHPAVKMWKGYEIALLDYGMRICAEWIDRGYKDTLYAKFNTIYWNTDKPDIAPIWLGDKQFHSSHRASLLAKSPEHYSQFGWEELPIIAYHWPV